MSLVTDFRDFVLRGNVVDLAVGVVIGAAFAGVVKAFTDDILTPIISLPGKQSIGDWAPTIFNVTFKVGDFLNTIVSFLITAFVVYFFVVKPINLLMARLKPSTPAPETTRECPYCVSKVPVTATRCAFCTSDLATGVVAA